MWGHGKEGAGFSERRSDSSRGKAGVEIKQSLNSAKVVHRQRTEEVWEGVLCETTC